MLNFTLDYKASAMDEEPLKILSFLSCQIDQRMAKGIIVQIMSPHPLKGPWTQETATKQEAPKKTTYIDEVAPNERSNVVVSKQMIN